MKGSHNKCYRCGEWHQRLFPIYDNLSETKQYICRKCVAELTISAIPEWLIASITANIIQRFGETLIENKQDGKA